MIALFGGAFDPFHNGHVAAITHLLRDSRITKVVVVPSGDRPDKKDVSAACHRVAMAQSGIAEVFGDNPRVIVSDLQAGGAVGYATIDLVMHFESETSTPVAVVIGQELVVDLPHWKDAEKLRHKAQFLVLQRPGMEGMVVLPGWKLEVASPFGSSGVVVSSTELRQRLAAGLTCSDLLPARVLHYCKKHKLYGAV
jgi:nicotinate-nucleotide adenylyltransferase